MGIVTRYSVRAIAVTDAGVGDPAIATHGMFVQATLAAKKPASQANRAGNQNI